MRQAKDFQAALTLLQGLGFVRPFGEDSRSWEIRRVLKARLTAAYLEKLKEQLVATLAEKERGKASEGRSGE